ncbi:Ger(x)C family spore germination protein [Paenibacillus arenilitoris]|uniref:Ger(X)C family spore germination protein n=1 Tax=Paenibacillus arenilitoris TaxID=2772299 RepID=A0A927CKU5_9BACL|nr:Ger(x)C family spore germination protein [Paenibacillus arenilitoris]MBD2869894.1 Ger(x)C family spore germination protein [Paenibacillus arenilitoris]
MIRMLSMLLCLSLFFMLLAGCWSRRELDELGISVGIGIDKAGKGYKVTTQVVSPGEIAAAKPSGNRAPVTVYEATGETVIEAIRKITTMSSRPIYLAHLRVLVIGEALAREGIHKPLDHFSRDHEVRTDYFVIVAKGTTASNVLKILTPIEKIPANNLYLSLDTSQKEWAPAATVTLDELISDIVSDGKNPALSAVKVVDKQIGQTQKNIEIIKPPGHLRFSGIAVFRDDKLIGFLNEKESKGYNYVTDNVKNTVGSMACPNGEKIAVEIMKSKTKVKAKMSNGNPRIEIKVSMEDNIGEVECQIDITKRETIAELEKIAERRVHDNIMNTVKKVQRDLKVDIFGFGEAMRMENPAAWNQLKQNWNERFSDLDVFVTADVKIRRIGTVANSFHKEGEE